MERDLTVLLVEDDEYECTLINEQIENTDGICSIGTTNNSIEAFEIVIAEIPDAVILDLELLNGVGSGIDFLELLSKSGLQHIPYILVTTNNISKITHKKVRSLGADFIISKHQGDYSAKKVVEFLMSLKDIIHEVYVPKEIIDRKPNFDDKKYSGKRIMSAVYKELDLIGVSPKLTGRIYLSEAIVLIINQPTVNIYPILSGKFKKADASIERAMQNAINITWRKSSIDDLIRHYTARVRSEKGVPTISEFIHYYAEKITSNY